MARNILEKYQECREQQEADSVDSCNMSNLLWYSNLLPNKRVVSAEVDAIHDLRRRSSNGSMPSYIDSQSKKWNEKLKLTWARVTKGGRSPLFMHSRTTAAKSLGIAPSPTEAQRPISSPQQPYSYLRDESFLCLISENPKIIDASDLGWLSPYALGKISQAKTSLQVLKLRNLKQLNGSVLRSILDGTFVRLKELDLSGCVYISTADLTSALQNFTPHLTKLILNGTKQLFACNYYKLSSSVTTSSQTRYKNNDFQLNLNLHHPSLAPEVQRSLFSVVCYMGEVYGSKYDNLFVSLVGKNKLPDCTRGKRLCLYQFVFQDIITSCLGHKRVGKQCGGKFFDWIVQYVVSGLERDLIRKIIAMLIQNGFTSLVYDTFVEQCKIKYETLINDTHYYDFTLVLRYVYEIEQHNSGPTNYDDVENSHSTVTDVEKLLLRDEEPIRLISTISGMKCLQSLDLSDNDTLSPYHFIRFLGGGCGSENAADKWKLYNDWVKDKSWYKDFKNTLPYEAEISSSSVAEERDVNVDEFSTFKWGSFSFDTSQKYVGKVLNEVQVSNFLAGIYYSKYVYDDIHGVDKHGKGIDFFFNQYFDETFQNFSNRCEKKKQMKFSIIHLAKDNFQLLLFCFLNSWMEHNDFSLSQPELDFFCNFVLTIISRVLPIKYFLGVYPDVALSDNYIVPVRDAISAVKILFWEAPPKVYKSDEFRLITQLRKMKEKKNVKGVAVIKMSNLLRCALMFFLLTAAKKKYMPTLRRRLYICHNDGDDDKSKPRGGNGKGKKKNKDSADSIIGSKKYKKDLQQLRRQLATDDKMGIEHGKRYLQKQYENRYKDVDIDAICIQRPFPATPRLPLLELCLSRCICVTDELCVKVAQMCPMLRSISIACCAEVTDYGLSAIARGCGGMLRINVSGLNRLTDYSLNAVAAGCPDLQHLVASNCSRISDVGLFTVFARGKISSLDISACDNVSGNIIFAALYHLKTLKTIFFTFKNELYERFPQGIQEIERMYPSIKFMCQTEVDTTIFEQNKEKKSMPVSTSGKPKNKNKKN